MLFKALKSLKPNINQKGIMIDYKGAAFNAIETEFLGNDEVLINDI